MPRAPRTARSPRANRATVLYCWELGAGLGHFGKFDQVAVELLRRGHRVVFAWRDVTRVPQGLRRSGIEIIQAPVWLHAVRGLAEPPVSLVEILLRHGFMDGVMLGNLAHAWCALFRGVKPDLVVGDYAPSAMLAARGQRTLRAVLGTGFFIPPRSNPMRPFMTVAGAGEERIRDGERLALVAANAALASIGAREIGSMSDLYDVDERLLVTYPELDHYPGRQGETYWGAPPGLGGGVAPLWPVGRGPRLFVYLESQHPALEAVLGAIAALRWPAIAYLPGVSAELRRRHGGSNIVFSDSPYDMRRVRAECDIGINNAGHGVLASLAMAGKPLLVMPQFLEQNVLARRLVLHGLALAPAAARPAADEVEALLLRLASEPGFPRRARTFAARNAGLAPETFVERIADRCEAALARRGRRA